MSPPDECRDHVAEEGQEKSVESEVRYVGVNGHGGPQSPVLPLQQDLFRNCIQTAGQGRLFPAEQSGPKHDAEADDRDVETVFSSSS